MLVCTMSDREKRNQIAKDAVELFKHVRYTLHKKLVRMIKGFNKFPRILRTSYVTKNGNKYHLLIKANSRSELENYIWGLYYTIMDSNEGKYALVVSNTPGSRVMSYQIYSPHLFTRYSERCGVSLYEEERIHRFMEESMGLEYTAVREYEEGKVMAPVKRGVILGDTKDDIVVFKTFVDTDRLCDSQIEVGNDAAESARQVLDLFEAMMKWKRKYR